MTTCFAIDAGFVAAGIIVIIVLAAYQQNVSDGVWRVSFGIGIVLPVVLLFFRLRLVNSTQYAKHAMKERIPYPLIFKRYWRPIIGTSLAWFMYDFVVSTDLKALRFNAQDIPLIRKNTNDRSTPLASSAPPSSPASIRPAPSRKPSASAPPSTPSTSPAACSEACSWTRLGAGRRWPWASCCGPSWALSSAARSSRS